MAGRGTNRGTHRAASSRWRFCARLNKFGIATSGSARASSSSAVRRPRPSPRPTSGDVTRRHAHRAQWKHHDELRNAARAPARESRGRSSRADKRGYAPLETPPRERTARVDAREARAPMCAPRPRCQTRTRALRRRRPSRITDCLPTQVPWTSSRAHHASTSTDGREGRASRVLVAEFVRRTPLANVHRVSSRRRVATRELDASPGEWL